MIPYKFKGYQTILKAPSDWDENKYGGKCVDLPVSRAGGMVTSGWKFGLKERLMVALGANIQLHVVGSGQPPVAFTVTFK